jgi:uncharacterized protein involved in outer membrane biogenesis
MRRAAKVVLGALFLYLILMTATGLVAKSLVSGARMQQALALFGAELPGPVTAARGSFSLTKWFRFQPTVVMDRVRVGNPPGFSERPLLQASQLSAEVDLLSALRGGWQVKRFALEQPELTVERDRNGQSNLERFFQGLSKRRSETQGEGGRPGGPAVAVNGLFIRSGTLRFVEAGSRETLTLRNLDLSLEDFAADRSCTIRFSTRPFGEGVSQVRFDGKVGPAGRESIPADGNLSVELAPAEAPPALRTRYLGDLLRDPPRASRASLQAKLTGDLARTLEGKGKLSLSGLELGAGRQHRLALRGEAPFQITLRRVLANPAFDLLIPSGSLELGEGRWKGRAELAYDGSRFRGNGSGAVAGVDVNAMLAAFASSRDAVFGKAEIPEFRLQFAGDDADQIRDSLSGEGKIVLDQGRIALFDLAGSIERHARRLLTGEAPAEGETAFARLTSRVRIQNRQVLFEDLVLEHPSTQVVGKGSVDFDRNLNLDLGVLVGGDVARLLGGKPDDAGKTTVRVPVKIEGAMRSPKLYPDLGRVVREKAVEKAKGLLDSLFQKKPVEKTEPRP